MGVTRMQNQPWGMCQRCGWQYPLNKIRTEWTNLKVCPECFDPRPAQLSPPQVKPEGVALPNASPEPDFSPAGSKTYDWPSIAAGSTASTTVTVTGATVGDGKYYAADMDLGWSGLISTATVTAPNTVTVTALNPTAAAISLASDTLSVTQVSI